MINNNFKNFEDEVAKKYKLIANKGDGYSVIRFDDDSLVYLYSILEKNLIDKLDSQTVGLILSDFISELIVNDLREYERLVK